MIGTGSTAKREHAEGIGTRFVDYTAEDVAAAARELVPGGFDGIVDLVGGASLRTVAPLARDPRDVIAVGDASVPDLGGRFVERRVDRENLERSARLALDGGLAPSSPRSIRSPKPRPPSPPSRTVTPRARSSSRWREKRPAPDAAARSLAGTGENPWSARHPGMPRPQPVPRPAGPGVGHDLREERARGALPEHRVGNGDAVWSGELWSPHWAAV